MDKNKKKDVWATVSDWMKRKDPQTKAIADILDDMDRKYGYVPAGEGVVIKK